MGATGSLTPGVETVDIARAAVRRRGSDVSLITYGGSLPKALEAAERLEADGIAAEVVDLRVLRPLDTDTVLESVARTHRVVVIDEAWRSYGPAAELSALIAEEALWDLDAPVQRVATAEVPLPYAGHLEHAALPQVEDIVAAVRRIEKL